MLHNLAWYGNFFSVHIFFSILINFLAYLKCWLAIIEVTNHPVLKPARYLWRAGGLSWWQMFENAVDYLRLLANRRDNSTHFLLSWRACRFLTSLRKQRQRLKIQIQIKCFLHDRWNKIIYLPIFSNKINYFFTESVKTNMISI